MAEVGFIPEQSRRSRSLLTLVKNPINQLTADKVTKRDLVINFRKPRPGELAAALAITGDEDAATFAEKARAILVDALEPTPAPPRSALRRAGQPHGAQGQFERHNFEALLAQVAEPVHEPVMRNLLEAQSRPISSVRTRSVRWYLKEQRRSPRRGREPQGGRGRGAAGEVHGRGPHPRPELPSGSPSLGEGR